MLTQRSNNSIIPYSINFQQSEAEMSLSEHLEEVRQRDEDGHHDNHHGESFIRSRPPLLRVQDVSGHPAELRRRRNLEWVVLAT